MKDYYRLLGLTPSATENEIREAYMRLKQIFNIENPSLYSIYDENEVKRIIQELREAVSILLDPEKRMNYDESLMHEGIYPENSFRTLREEVQEKEPIQAPPSFVEEIEGSGMFFRALRESMGLDIRDVARITRIQTSYLQAIEEEDFEKLPPRVFVRGFVLTYAKLLKVPEIDRVVNEYMKKYDERMGSK